MGELRFVVIVCAVILVVWALLVPEAIIYIARERGAVSEIENIWKKRWLGSLLLAVGILCVVLGWWLPIPSGYAITGVAVIAGIMALREMNGWERSLWFVILVLFAAMEIRAINRDREKANNDFSSISGGLKKAIEQGTAAVSALQIVIESTTTIKEKWRLRRQE